MAYNQANGYNVSTAITPPTGNGMSLSDNRSICFVSSGVTSLSVADSELQWLNINGATATNRTDAWRQFLGLQGFNYSTYPDARHSWLKSLGYTGDTQDMLNQLWIACPNFNLPSPSAWIDGDGWNDAEQWID